MSTAKLSAVTKPTPAPGAVLTAADVARLPRNLATADVDYELHDGRLVVMAPPGDVHGKRQARFSAYLFVQGEQRGHGESRAEVGILLRRTRITSLVATPRF